MCLQASRGQFNTGCVFGRVWEGGESAGSVQVSCPASSNHSGQVLTAPPGASAGAGPCSAGDQHTLKPNPDCPTAFLQCCTLTLGGQTGAVTTKAKADTVSQHNLPACLSASLSCLSACLL